MSIAEKKYKPISLDKTKHFEIGNPVVRGKIKLRISCSYLCYPQKQNNRCNHRVHHALTSSKQQKRS